MAPADEEKTEPVAGSLGPSTDRISSAEPDPRDDTDSDSSDHEEAAQPDDEKSQKFDETQAYDLESGPAGLNVDNTLSQGQSRAHSRASSTRSRALSIVPRAHRRGLFGRFAIIPEVNRPYDYSNKTKWTITTVVALAAAGAPIGSSIFYPALSQMAVDLNASPTITNLTVALYMLSMSIFPLWWSSFSETFGRRTIYLISFTLFVIFSVLSAVSTNIAMLIVMRILGGGASASVQAVGAGTIADIWETHERGTAMGTFYLGPLTGPLFAPIIGGALSQGFGWQSTMWFLTIYGGVTLLMIFFGLPETLAKRKPVVPDVIQQASIPESTADSDIAPHLTRMSTRQSMKQHTKASAEFLKRALIDPLECITYLRFPPVAITVYFAAVTFGSLFVLNISTQSAFSQPPYGFSELIVGLLYIPSSIGYVSASFLGGRWIDKIMAREARKAGRYDANGKLIYLPEDRMRENAWLAATMYPAALVWFGWSTDKGVHWIVPSIANFFFGLGSMLVFGAATTMLTEFMPRKSSSGVALNNFVRNIFSCVGAIVSQPLLNAMGVGWLCTMIALVCWISGNLSIWALKRYGPGWRKKMDEKLKVVR